MKNFNQLLYICGFITIICIFIALYQQYNGDIIKILYLIIFVIIMSLCGYIYNLIKNQIKKSRKNKLEDDKIDE